MSTAYCLQNRVRLYVINLTVKELDRKTYHSPPHQCHPHSPSLRHTGTFWGGNVCHQHNGTRSSSFVCDSLTHPNGRGNGPCHRTLENQGCTFSHGRTETHLVDQKSLLTQRETGVITSHLKYMYRNNLVCRFLDIPLHQIHLDSPLLRHTSGSIKRTLNHQYRALSPWDIDNHWMWPDSLTHQIHHGSQRGRYKPDSLKHSSDNLCRESHL